MRRVAAAIALILFLMSVLFFGFTSFAHGAVTKKHDNSLGVIQYQTNPFTYIEASITNVSLVGTGVNLRLQPRGVYSLFTQEILLCNYDNVAEKFAGKRGLMVLTYETVAHRSIEGIGCHDLRSVDEVKEERPQ